MASTTVLKIGPTDELATTGLQATGATELNNDDVNGDRSFIVAGIYIEKPANCVVTCSLAFAVLLADGTTTITLTIPLFSTTASVTTGLYLEDRHVPVPYGASLRFTSTGGTTGAKKVVVMGRRVDA